MSDRREVAHLTAERERLQRENEELRRALAADERRYLELFDAAPDASIVTDTMGTIQEGNRAAAVLLGVERRLLVGKALVVYLRPRSIFRRALIDARHGAFEERELTAQNRERGGVEVGVTASPFMGSDGATGVRWILRDISRRRGAEEEVRRLNAELEARVRLRTRDLEAANRAKDVLLEELERRSRVEREFITNAAHELRTPVSAIASAVEVLEAGAKDDPVARDRFLTHVGEQSRRLQRLAYSLLVLARSQMGQEPPRKEPLEVEPLLRDVVRALAPPPQVDVEIDCPGRMSLLGNRELVEQAIINVAQNATKHGGDCPVRIEARRNGDSVMIAVIDSGPGMSEEDRRRAVQHFYRGSEIDRDGFGLGLSIAVQSIHALGGTIDIDSAPRQGTTVRMTLPEAAA
jgi:PAS domain S-box-containing protein